MTVQATQQEGFTGLSVEDISIDSGGRVAITNPVVAERLANIAPQRKRPRPKPNTNCGDACNSTKGCGPLDLICGPPNTKPNCSCKK